MSQRQEERYSSRLGGENFLIRIQYQENATWQGTIQWLEGGRTQTFRSLLEMIVLIREALEQSRFPGFSLRSWENRAGEVSADPDEDKTSGEEPEREVLA